jgi:hypothetical protein
VVRWAAFSPPTSESCCLDCRQGADAPGRSTICVGSPVRADVTHRGGAQPLTSRTGPVNLCSDDVHASAVVCERAGLVASRT